MKYRRSEQAEDIDFQLNQLLNEGLELSDNLRGGLLEVTLSIGENSITHSLGFKPIGFILLYKDLEGDIFGSRIDEWTNEVLFLKSSVSNQKVRLFVV